MIVVRFLAATAAMALYCLAPAQAQCNGQFAAGTICGNSSASQALPRSVPFSSFTSAYLYPQNYGTIGSGNDGPAINACLTAAAAVNGTCLVPRKATAYVTTQEIVVPQNASLMCEGDTTEIDSGQAGMTNLVRITALNHGGVYNCILANRFNTTNGVNFDPATFGNNRLVVSNVKSYFFVNNYYNTNADYFAVINSWSQGATGYSLRSVKSGTGSLISNFKVLGDAAGIRYSDGGFNTEGATIVDSQILVNGTGKSIQFDEALDLQISNTVVEGAIYLNATTNPVADVRINSVYISPPSGGGGTDTSGFLAEGNIADLNINGLTVANYSACGISLKATAMYSVQRVAMRGLRLLGNGTGAGSADLCIDASVGGVANVSVSDSWFESTGGSVVSVREINTNTITATYAPTNTYFAAQTTSRSNVFVVSGGVPFVNANLTQSYSGVLTAATPICGGGAGSPPVSCTTKNAAGETALDGSNPTPVTTGLASIVSCTLTIKTTSAPGLGTSVVTYGSSGGTMNMYGWKPTGAGDATLIASTGTDTVGWQCIGT